MRRIISFRTLLSVLIAGALAIPVTVMAQSLPDASFTSTTTAIDGSLTYCGALWNFLGLLGSCQVVAITPANSVTEGASGTIDNVASGLTVMAGTQQVATIGSSDDGATDSLTATNDSSNQTENQQTVSLLGGAVTYFQVQASNDCVAAAPNASNNTIAVTCTPPTTITSLAIQGVPVFNSTTTVAPGTRIQLNNVPITIQGVSLLFNGQLIIGDSRITGSGTNSAMVEVMPLHLTGQACALGSFGCLLGYVNVDVVDDFNSNINTTFQYLTQQLVPVTNVVAIQLLNEP